ncbi:MAG: hypothetical protein DRJ66_05390 [Thermoprotei archaeon]|nr:MAG: hypothetical protein DRJ66_05390 [Thermoprotei archaeon]
MKVVGIYGKHELISRIAEELALELDFKLKRYVSVSRINTFNEDVVPVIWVPLSKSNEHGVVNVLGERKLFAFNNSGCLNNPSVRKRLMNDIDKIMNLGYKELVLDAIRYPSPHDHITFLSCFCKYCISKEPQLLKVKDRIRNSISFNDVETFISSIEDLARIRIRFVSEVLSEIREHTKSHGVRISAAIFPPSLAKLVGQDYKSLANYLDEIQIMLYHKCSGAACLNHEIASLIKLLNDIFHDKSIVKRVIDALLDTVKVSLDISTLENEGIKHEVLIGELRRATEMGLNVPIIPILWYDHKLVKILHGIREEIPTVVKIMLFIP